MAVLNSDEQEWERHVHLKPETVSRKYLCSPVCRVLGVQSPIRGSGKDAPFPELELNHQFLIQDDLQLMCTIREKSVAPTRGLASRKVKVNADVFFSLFL